MKWPSGDQDLISIIIPNCNNGDGLVKTVEGVLADPFYPHFEVLVLDDASTDDSCTRLPADPRVRLFRSPQPVGQVALREWGVREARGTLLQFLEAHHCFAPGWLANLYEALKRRNFRGLVGPLVATLDEQSWGFGPNLSYGWLGWERCFCSRHLHRKEVGPDGQVPAFGSHAVLVARALHLEIGGFCPLFQEHGSYLVEYCLRAAKCGYSSYVEVSSVVGSLFGDSFAHPVSWAQLTANNLLLGYLDQGLTGLSVARRCSSQRPQYDEGLALFEQLRESAQTYRLESMAPPTQAPDGDGERVSVVLAAHNEGDSLRRTVESVQSQDLDVELVLVDDGSQDGSFAFLQQERYREDGRIRHVRFEQSVGCIRSRHQGVLLASGDSLLFLDAHMALGPQALVNLQASLRRAGPLAAVVPDVATLNESTWTIGPSTGRVFSINEKLNFIWENPPLPGGLVAVGGGCCVLMSRALYHRVGGFDLALRRWGSEFTDLFLKIYSLGGFCYWESDVRVGHLFRARFPYAMSFGDIVYNKLRTAYIHFSPQVFERFAAGTASEVGMAEARLLFEEHRPSLERRRQAQLSNAHRHPDWYVSTFLPGLLGGPPG